MAVEKELEDYVKAQKTLGVNDSAIRKSLLDAGYSEEEFRPLLAKHAHASRSELSITTKSLLYLIIVIIICFGLLIAYITYDYNTKLNELSALQKESTANLSSQISSQTDSIKQDVALMERKLGAEITDTKTVMDAANQETRQSIETLNYQTMTRDSALSDSIHSMTNRSLTQLSSFQQQLTTFKEASVDFSAVIPSAVDAVVTIGKKGQGYFTTAGSGVVINNVGHVVTNFHVVDQLNPITVKMHDGTEYTATLVGKDRAWDVAVLELVTDRKDFGYLKFADSSKTTVGQHIIAVGNPIGLDSTVTEGIISSTNRLIAGDEADIYYLQTDVAINAGNSGGPLIDKDGQIVGIATLKYARTGFEGLSFALRSDDVQRIVLDILQEGG